MIKRYIIIIFFVLFSAHVWASDLPEGMVLSEASVNQHDIESIKRGAKFFATTCMSCHTLVYLRYDKLAKEAGITLDKMPLNVTTWPNGVKPPDLSSEADVRGPNWIYTYLHSFYQDSTRPTGANNLVFPGTAMPYILAPYYGNQTLNPNPTKDLLGRYRWYDAVILTKQGSMTPEQYDATANDLVNFLVYASAPYQNEQRKIGVWVLGFLVVLWFLFYLLKNEYWKDVKKNKEY